MLYINCEGYTELFSKVDENNGGYLPSRDVASNLQINQGPYSWKHTKTLEPP